MSRGARHYADYRIQKERAIEQQHAGIQRILQEHKRTDLHNASELRVENVRRNREEASERREIWRDHHYVKGEQEKARKKHLEDIEDRLAHELQMRRVQATRDEADRQRIFEGSEELSTLRRQLAAAATNKMRAMQLLDNQARGLQEDQREAAMIGHIEGKRLREEELELQLQQEKQNQYLRIQHTNKDQIAAREWQKQQDGKREFQRDKADVDALVARICAEDRQEAEARRVQRETERQVFAAQKRDREAQDEATRRWEAEQDAMIEEFAFKKREQQEELARAKEQEELERRRILYSMLDQQVAVRSEADRKQMILDDYHEEQKLDEYRRREEAETRKKLEDQAMLRQFWNQAQQQKEVKAQMREEEEKQMRDDLMAKFAYDDRIEQMNDQKRRRKLLEHRREVERQIQLRREAYEAERLREMEDLQRARAREEDRLRVIEGERQRMLAAAAPLRDFFPKGVYQHESDLALVGESLPPRHDGDRRPNSLGRPSSQVQLRGGAAPGAGPPRPASHGPGRPTGMRAAWGTPPSSPGRDAPRGGAPFLPPRRTMGGYGLSI